MTLFILVMGGLRWKSNVLMSAFLVTGVIFGVFFIVNLFLWGAQSSGAIPFTTLVALLCLWFGISLPLTFIGSFLGFRRVVCLRIKLFYFYYIFVSLLNLLLKLIRYHVKYQTKTGYLILYLVH